MLSIIVITTVNIINAIVLLLGIVCLSRYIDNEVLFMFCTMFFMIVYGAVSCYEVIKLENYFKKKSNEK